MKLMKIEKPTTRNGWVSRILFMVMTVLLAALLCYLLISEANIQGAALETYKKILSNRDYQYPSDESPESIARQYSYRLAEYVGAIAGAIWFSISAVAILCLCLRGTVVTGCVAWGISVAGALFWLGIDTQLNEYIFMKYHLFPFFSAETNLTILPYFKPILIILLIAAATYFLVARLIEHKKATTQPTE